MSEHPPDRGGAEYSSKLDRFSELPHYYQCLGRACAAAGILEEFYMVVDSGFDFAQAASSLRHELDAKLEASNVDAWLEHFGVPSSFEEPEVE